MNHRNILLHSVRALGLTTGLVTLLAAGCGGSHPGADDDDDGAGDAGHGDGGGGAADGGACTPSGAEVADGHDNDCDGVTDELTVCADASSGAVHATIAAAVAAADVGGVIEACPGTYPERLVIDKALDLRGTGGAAATIIDGGGQGAVLTVTGVAAPGVALRGLTLTHGSGAAGGGIHCEGSSLTIADSAVVGNHGDEGGGVFASGCQIHVTDTAFATNATAGDGGAMHLEATDGEVTGSSFTGNSADHGGAMSILDGALTIDHGAFSDNHAGVRGGALYLEADTMVSNSTFEANRCDWIGGAVYVRGRPEDFPDPDVAAAQRAPTFQSNTLSHNTARFEGGAFYSHWSSMKLFDNVITSNEAQNDDGGGLRLFTSTARLERNTIANNRSARSGGGMKSSHQQSVLIDNIITGNIAGGAGGGLELDNDASIVQGGTIADNTATVRGGGIDAGLFPWSGARFEDIAITHNHANIGGGLFVADNFEPIVARGLVVTGNTATHGAGMFVRATPLTLSNSIFAGNSAAGGDGGGLAVYPLDQNAESCPCAADPITMSFVTIYGNTAAAGAGVYAGYDAFSLTNSIIAGNDGPAVTAAAAPAAWGYNDTTPASFAGMADPTGASGNLSVDPMFTAANAGDFHLAAGSACRNAGNPALVDGDGTRAYLGCYGGPPAP